MSAAGPYLRLTAWPETLAVCRLAPEAGLPAWAGQGPFVSVTRTEDELSVVCAQAAVPAGVRCERGWRALRVEGPLDFSMTGVLAALAVPLADAGISIFAVSTYDTDYVLVRDTALERAAGVLAEAGHHVARDAGRRERG